MNIAHFCESIESGGGIASFISNLSHEQSKTNNITICSISYSPNIVSIDDSVTYLCLNKRKVGFSIKYPIKVFRLIRKNKFDIVHIHSAFLYYALSIILLHRRTKFVYTIHSDAQRENSSRWDKYFFWLKKWCFRHKWTYPVTISKVSKQSFDTLYGMDSHVIFNGIRQTHPNATDKIAQYRITEKTLVFLHPGRISEAKNQLVLCKVFDRLIKENKDIVLLIAGTIQDEQIYYNLSKYFSDRIVYIGQRNDILELLNKSDAMCLSSIWEGLPITLLESMSVGCTPICTPVGGITDVIQNNYNGILSSSTSENDYYDAIHRFINLHNDTKAILRKNCLKDFERYNIKKTSDLYLEYYNTISHTGK